MNQLQELISCLEEPGVEHLDHNLDFFTRRFAPLAAPAEALAHAETMCAASPHTSYLSLSQP